MILVVARSLTGTLVHRDGMHCRPALASARASVPVPEPVCQCQSPALGFDIARGPGRECLRCSALRCSADYALLWSALVCSGLLWSALFCSLWSALVCSVL
jgi:hypothetical protein